MASNLPDFPTFDVNAEPNSLAIEWNKWLQRFENLIIALGIEDDGRKRALLLFYAGKEVHDVYNTLVATDDDYAATKTKLTAHYEPSKNETFEVYNFRSQKQQEGESIDKFVTRLREAGSRCGFADKDKEIKHQIVFGCLSSKVRRKALNDNPDLTALVKYARLLESTATQASAIEDGNKKNIHKIAKPGKYSKRNFNNRTKETVEKTKVEAKLCYFCGGEYPTPRVGSHVRLLAFARTVMLLIISRRFVKRRSTLWRRHLKNPTRKPPVTNMCTTCKRRTLTT